MNRYHNNNLDRFIKLYHSKINNEWYEEHTFGAILIKVLKTENLDSYLDLDISLEEYINYLNLAREIIQKNGLTRLGDDDKILPEE